jgi:exonuclease III
MHLKIASWNLCGLGKFYRWPDTANWFLSHDIIMIQESLQVTKSFPIIDVSRYDVHALATGGRSRGGLTIALQNRVFNAAQVTVLLQEDYILVLHVVIPATSLSLLIANVYAPVHTTGYSPEILKTISAQLDLLSEQHPSATMIIAGRILLPCSQLTLFSILTHIQQPPKLCDL